MTMIFRSLYYVVIIISFACGKNRAAADHGAPADDSTFSNPLLPRGPDPWVFQKDTMYYYTPTMGNRIVIYSTGKMSALKDAPIKLAWTPPASGAYSKNIWAPELHHLRGKWYLYFAADDGDNSNHRMYALENPDASPLTDSWVFRGQISDSSNKWAIDGSVFEYKNQLYFIWSGWEGDVNGRQDIYIARMKDPLTIDGGRVRISKPDYDWEKIGSPAVNEGPEVVSNGDQLFLTYSASGCWTDDYSLGLLRLSSGGDPMNPSDWIKMPQPVFTKKPENGAFGPGHNGFFTSRDGTENWIIYHANSLASQGCGDARNPRMQRFTWKQDGSPDFGEPAKINARLRKPAGE